MNGNELLGILSRRHFLSRLSRSLFMTGGCLKKLRRGHRLCLALSAKREIEMTLGTEFNPVLIYCCTLWYAASPRLAAIKRTSERASERVCIRNRPHLSPTHIYIEMETRINSIFTRHKIMLWEDAPMLNGSCRAILLHLRIDTRCCLAAMLKSECRETLSDYTLRN